MYEIEVRFPKYLCVELPLRPMSPDPHRRCYLLDEAIQSLGTYERTLRADGFSVDLVGNIRSLDDAQTIAANLKRLLEGYQKRENEGTSYFSGDDDDDDRKTVGKEFVITIVSPGEPRYLRFTGAVGSEAG